MSITIDAAQIRSIRQRFQSLSTWERGDNRAPHKPLLVLWSLGHYARGGSRLISYREIDAGLRRLLSNFGSVSAQRRPHPEYPFWYLKNDGIWEVHAEGARPRAGKAGQPPCSELLRVGAVGGLLPDVYEALRSQPELQRQIVDDLLHAHFPDTTHEDLLQAAGLELTGALAAKTSRNPAFRENVLCAYGYRCAICGFSMRLGDVLVGVEAAHIKWHQAGGPCDVKNGLALCSLHHKLFDRGAFTISHRGYIEVAKRVNGETASALIELHDTPLSRPSDPLDVPDGVYIDWHRDQVFQKPAVRGS